MRAAEPLGGWRDQWHASSTADPRFSSISGIQSAGILTGDSEINEPEIVKSQGPDKTWGTA